MSIPQHHELLGGESLQPHRAAGVKFVCADAGNLSLFQDHVFDYAVLSFTIHEMPPSIRLPVLREAMRISEQVIIADYVIPMPINTAGMINLYLEFTAGYDHLRGFLDFRDHRGLDGLIEEAGLRVEEEKTESLDVLMRCANE